jgi:hypothetical protein
MSHLVQAPTSMLSLTWGMRKCPSARVSSVLMRSYQAKLRNYGALAGAGEVFNVTGRCSTDVPLCRRH